MKEIFRINEEYELEFEPWILTVPEFKKIIRADKGSPGDHRGLAKKLAKRQLAYVWFMVDFKSPIEGDEDEREKHYEAIKYTGLTEEDINEDVRIGMTWYQDAQYKAARSLHTVEAVRIGLDETDKYFKSFKHDATDKLGRLKFSMKEVLSNIAMLGKAYDQLEIFEAKVKAELKAVGGARGKNTVLGGKEGNRDATWDEGSRPDNTTSKFQMSDVLSVTGQLQGINDDLINEEIVRDGIS